jgi:hypothetical protein
MITETYYRVASPDVIHELLDDEVMLIHLSRGIYFSLSGSGPLMFESLIEGASPGGLAATLAARTDGDATTIAAAVTRILRELSKHGLVVACAEVPSAASPEAPTEALKRPFTEPRLEAFADLQDLLTADPIHDVEPTGWPHVKESVSK